MKLAKVVLDINTLSLDEPFTYIIRDDSPDFDESTKIPSDMYSKIVKTHNNLLSKLDRDRELGRGYAIEVGASAIVPFGNMLRMGFVVDIFDDCDLDNSIEVEKLKPIVCACTKPFFDENQSKFASWISRKYVAPLASCVRLFVPSGATPKLVHGKNGWYTKRNLADIKDVGLDYDLSGINEKLSYTRPEKLTVEQTLALSVIEGAEHSKQSSVVLLDGVTGSGKTEVYLQAISRTIQSGKNAIVLVPEISLTPQTVSRFKDRFGDIVAVVHSKMTQKARYSEWERMKRGLARVVVGPRSALFSPLINLGLIVIDEEHDSSYKQESSPRYVTHDCALWLADLHQATVVLGSATPSIETLYKCEKEDRWYRVEMPRRANNAAMPKIEVVDMAAEFNSGQKSMFSQRLKTSIIEEVEAGHKVILLHNRRGFANYMFCRDCGYIPMCDKCDVSLTYHERLKVDSFIGNEEVRGIMPMLACHHCGKLQKPSPRCPKCGSVYFAKLGAGTQSVEDQLYRFLGNISSQMPRVIRMDSDTTKQKDGHQKCLDEFAKPGAAILLGTQMIAKGLDFGDVTLVGVVLADTNLRLPDFRSNERTFQLISQVAGRAGRANLAGKVIVQTYCADNIAIRAAANYNRALFLKTELPKRKLLKLSPYFDLVNVLVWGPIEAETKQACVNLHKTIIDYRRNVTGDNWDVGEPMPCTLGRVRGNYRYHITLKSNKMMDISKFIFDCVQKFRSSYSSNARLKVNIAVDVDPYNLL